MSLLQSLNLLQYPAAEIFTGVMFVVTYILSSIFYHSLSLNMINLAVSSVMLVILLSDLRYQVIPDEMQVSLVLLSIGKFIIMHIHFEQNVLEQVMTMNFMSATAWFLIAGVVTMLPLLTLFIITKGKGMGFGDVKLAFGMGLFLGLWNGLISLYIAFMVGGVIGLVLLAIKRGTLKTKVAFGPFLILGLFIMQYFEYWIWLWIHQVYGY
jgi:leader peptidase (prepilin peptidase)/N-methyltransferase